MSVEIVADQPEPCGIRVTVIKEILDLMGPVDRGALRLDVNSPPARQGLSEQKHVGRAHPFVLIIIAQWLPRLRWQGLTGFLDQLYGLFVHVDHRVLGIIGLLRGPTHLPCWPQSPHFFPAESPSTCAGAV